MSTYSEALPHILGRQFADFETVAEPEYAQAEPLRHPNEFAQEQIRTLVRRVFAPGWPKPSRQIVIAAVDTDDGVADICDHIGGHLARQVQASVTVVQSATENTSPEANAADGKSDFGSLRKHSRQVSGNLWHMSPTVFAPAGDNSAAWLKGRLAELRLEFDYSVIHCPPAASFSEAALFGHWSDGVVLVIEGNSTRRAVAQKVKESLHAANVRVLGAILNRRQFPIPHSIYQRL